MRNSLVLLLINALLFGCNRGGNTRKEINMNGIWEIARTDSMAVIPDVFPSKIPVPGLVDMAEPIVNIQDSVYDNSVWWYRRTFSLQDMNKKVILLKINKARYHTRVFVNGKPAGENIYNFTPSLFDIKPFLRSDGSENEIVIAVGSRNNLPDTVTNGWDFEKIRYIPGIYDDVKLILSDYPHIQNVQVAPDIENERLRVVAEIQAEKALRTGITYIVRESVSKAVVAKGSVKQNHRDIGQISKVDFLIPMEGCRLWSPEDPFLYDLELITSGDNVNTRFGMRTFSASRDSAIFLLNGKPYYMRGTNVCIYRFFEDPDRNDLPWDSEWVTKLHERFKDMHWNSIRYCIGFPPERWYEIADSLGFLIQDEYPLWTLGRDNFEKYLGKINSDQLAAEYREWMRERWNHPCVVIWDAQNESITNVTGEAIRLVRSLDLSNRPWDNGWAAPDSPADAIESHPYLFSRYMRRVPAKEGYLKELLQVPRIPDNDPNSHSPSSDGQVYKNPVILNEYGWIWLNRNGSTTTLTDNVYKNVFPEADTPEKRLEVYARNLAILTEYWRSHRKAAAVMHFCGLGYSRPEEPRGQTSDNFTDLLNLVYEPYFYKYVKQAFSPVAVMAELWESSLKKSQQLNIPLHIINDTYDRIEDSIRLALYIGDDIAFDRSVPYILDGLQKKIVEIPFSVPDKTGNCRLEAVIKYKGEPVKSIREFKIK